MVNFIPYFHVVTLTQAFYTIHIPQNFMKKLKYESHEFEVDVVANKKIYSSLVSDLETQKQDQAITFYLSHRYIFYTTEFANFLELSGIDQTKENELIHYRTNDDHFVYEGWYDIVGRMTDKETLSFYWENDKYTTNIYFRQHAHHAARNEFTGLNTFRLEFAIVVHGKFLS